MNGYKLLHNYNDSQEAMIIISIKGKQCGERKKKESSPISRHRFSHNFANKTILSKLCEIRFYSVALTRLDLKNVVPGVAQHDANSKYKVPGCCNL